MTTQRCARGLVFLSISLAGMFHAQFSSSQVIDVGQKAPGVAEEVATLAPPESRFPLNGPMALSLPFLVVASTIVEGDSQRSAAFIFERNSAGAWSAGRKLGEFETIDQHFEVDIDGQRAVIAASGAAHIYELRAGSWQRVATLAKPATATDFGSDAAVSQDYIAVGGISEGRFAAYVYVRTGADEWTFAARLLAGQTWNATGVIGPSLDAEHTSGASEPTVRVAIGSPNYQPGSTDPGAIKVFKIDENGVWIEVETIESFAPAPPPVREQVDYEALIAFGSNKSREVKIAYEIEPDSYGREDVELPVDVFMNGPRTSFGLSGTSVAVGEPQNEDRGASSGSVTIYRHPNAEDPPTVADVKFYASDARSGLELGRFVAFEDRIVAAGSRNKVYIFEAPLSDPPDLVQDDFEDGDAAGWSGHSSDWSVVTADGSRVYRQRGDGGTPLALLNDVNWTNQSVQADIRPRVFNGTGRWAGLVLRYHDDENYYWVALRNTNTIDIVRRAKGVNTILASAPYTVSTTRSYRVRFEAVGTWLRVYVDAARVVQTRDSTFASGGLGLRTGWTRADYDNIVVSPNPLLVLLYDDFQDGDVAGWQLEPRANWSNVATGSRVLRQSVASGLSRAIAGVHISLFRPELSDQIIEARVRPLSFASGAESWVGLFVRGMRDDDYTYVTLNSNGTVSLRKRQDDVVRTLASAPLAVTAGTSRQVRLEAIDRYLRVYVDGKFVLAVRDPSEVWEVDPRANYGLITSGARAEFDGVRVTWP